MVDGLWDMGKIGKRDSEILMAVSQARDNQGLMWGCHKRQQTKGLKNDESAERTEILEREREE